MRPPTRSDPAGAGSNARDVTPVLRPTAQGNTTPPGSGNEGGAFRGRCRRLLSCALAGHEKPALRSRHSGIALLLVWGRVQSETLRAVYPERAERDSSLRSE
jgi:hypothetical protein